MRSKPDNQEPIKPGAEGVYRDTILVFTAGTSALMNTFWP